MAETRRSRSGFALMAVLWAVVGASALGLTLEILARQSVSVATNQVAAARAYWAAEECAEILRDAAMTALRTARVDSRDPQRAWRRLDQSVATIVNSGRTSTCTAHLESNGARFDINRAAAADIERFLAAVGLEPARDDSLVDALLDWRDGDDLSRPLGAERAWYEASAKSAPRNGEFGDRRELYLVRGFDDLPSDQRAAIDSFVGVHADLVDLWHAPKVVLQTLPGFSSTVADALLALRRQHAGVQTMLELLPLLPSSVRDSIAAHYPEIIARAETQPNHWLLVSRGSSGVPRITTRLELLLSFSGARIGTVRRRFWLE